MATNILPKDINTNQTKKNQALAPVGRSLPREIMKWIQGLDLSYAVKDPKSYICRDLCNGFLIAEIFSRYYPGRVQMHSFDNSHNYLRRKNNWEQLQLFFKKNEIPFTQENYKIIREDYDWNQLFNFLCQIYTFLTQRKITEPPLATFVNSKDYATATMSDGGTQSFLLNDKGLERLDGLKEDQKNQADEIKDQLSEKQAQLSVSSKRTNFMRVPSKPISQTVENLHYQIEVKNINIRPVSICLTLNVQQVQGNINKIREQHMQQSNEQQDQLPHQFATKNQFQGSSNNNGVSGDSFQKSMQDQGAEKREGTGNKEKQMEKTIYEVFSICCKLKQILNETLTMRLQLPQFNEELKKFKVKNSTILQVFIDQISQFSDEFTGPFFSEIIQQKEAYINFIFKDTNDLWKFFNFCFSCIANLSAERESFVILCDLVHQFGQKSLSKDQIKTRSIFMEFFLPQIAQLISECILFEKKEMIIQLIYSFTPQEPQMRHQVIAQLKEQYKSAELFMQTLTVLVKFEKDFGDQSKQLLEDYMHYAETYLFSQSTALSSSALSIFVHIAEINPAQVHQKLYKKVDSIARNKWWQNRCLGIILFSRLIKGVIDSPNYQALIKAPQTGQKFFSIENDRLISDLKNQVNHFSKAIVVASQPISSDMLLSTTLIYIVDLLGDSRILLELFTKLILEVNNDLRQWVLYSGLKQVGEDGEEEQEQSQAIQDQYQYVISSDKSFKYKMNINSKVILEFTPSILIHLIERLKIEKLPALSVGQFQLLHFCFQNTDFKVMNMESCEQVANVSKEYIYLGMCDPEICVEASELVKKLADLQFKAEVAITENDQLFAQCINLIMKSDIEECQENLIFFLTKLVQESIQSGSEGLKGLMKSVVHILQEKSPELLQLPKIASAFEKLISQNDDSHFPSAVQQNIPPQIDEDMEISAVDKQQEEFIEEPIEGDFGEEQEDQYEDEEAQEQEAVQEQDEEDHELQDEN